MLLDVAYTLSLLHTDAERLLVLDMLGWAAEDASTCFVDDLKTRRSSPWALTLACKAISAGASHLGIVYECGDAAKSTISIEGVPDQAIHMAPLHFRGILQHGSPHMVRSADANPFLGVPDGLPQPRMDGRPHSGPAATNQAVRLRILRTLGTKAAIAMRVASSHATRCPVPVVARRFYMARADAKLSYLLPLIFGVQVAGARIVSIQARWALSVITGRCSWPRTLKVPSLRRKTWCADLGWDCLWIRCKVAALCLYAKLRADSDDFAHARLCSATDPASGGWIAAVRRLQKQLDIALWAPEPGCTKASLKRSLTRYRREVVMPAVVKMQNGIPPQPPLPWAWIGMNADVAFPQASFRLWWQLRALGQPHPAANCPWCDARPALTTLHLQHSCIMFAVRCWSRNLEPEEAFNFPSDEKWFLAVLQIATEIIEGCRNVWQDAAARAE